MTLVVAAFTNACRAPLKHAIYAQHLQRTGRAVHVEGLAIDGDTGVDGQPASCAVQYLNVAAIRCLILCDRPASADTINIFGRVILLA